jgi:uncharacterized integral membrane protein (TIGR00698 family)
VSDATAWEWVPGLVILGLIALGSALVAGPIQGLNALVLAIAVGALLSNVVGVPAALEPGFGLHSRLLEIGIVLLGASFSFGALTGAGLRVVLLVVVLTAFSLLAVTLGARALGLHSQVAALLAAGASICGGAAVVAAADVLDVEESDITAVAATVLLFDAVTLVAVPVIGTALGLPARQFGVWAGLTMFSTGPVLAAGFVYAPLAGQWAAFTKLICGTLLGGVALGYTVAYADDEEPDLGLLWTPFPTVLIGFLVVALVANSGLLTAGSLGILTSLTDWVLLLAFAGLGFRFRLSRMRETSTLLVAVTLAYLIVIGALALLAVGAVGL